MDVNTNAPKIHNTISIIGSLKNIATDITVITNKVISPFKNVNPRLINFLLFIYNRIKNFLIKSNGHRNRNFIISVYVNLRFF